MRHTFSSLVEKIKSNIVEIHVKGKTARRKADGSPVTDADLFLDQIILDWCKANLGDFQYFSEENPLVEPLDERITLVIVDPLDGTENFVSGLPIWGVSIAIFYPDGENDALLYFPDLNLILTKGSRISSSESRVYGLSSSLTSSEISQRLDKHQEYRILGSCAFNLYASITGSFKGFENMKKANTWDIAGGLILARYFGLKVILDGEEYDGNRISLLETHKFKVENTKKLYNST
jgi:fructose-1,6-bisphosphatase/inositol monophosphatase family enzyme